MKAVFLDRDGVINKYPGDKEYVKSWDEFEFLPDVILSLKLLSSRGFKIFVVSNQAGVSKGLYSREALDLITRNMLAALHKSGINIEAVYYCTHRSEDNCPCRKPKTGLIEKAFERLREQGLEAERGGSFFIGDTMMDIQAGKTAGLKTILIFSGKEKPQNRDSWGVIPDSTASDLRSAVDLVLKE